MTASVNFNDILTEAVAGSATINRGGPAASPPLRTKTEGPLNLFCNSEFDQ